MSGLDSHSSYPIDTRLFFEMISRSGHTGSGDRGAGFTQSPQRSKTAKVSCSGHSESSDRDDKEMKYTLLISHIRISGVIKQRIVLPAAKCNQHLNEAKAKRSVCGGSHCA